MDVEEFKQRFIQTRSVSTLYNFNNIYINFSTTTCIVIAITFMFNLCSFLVMSCQESKGREINSHPCTTRVQ